MFFFQSSNFNEIKAGLTIDPTTDMITAIDATVTAYRYELKNGDGSTFTQPLVITDNGVMAYDQTLELVLQGYGPTYRREWHALAKNRKLLIAIRDGNENIHLMGYDDGAEAKAGGWETGANLAEFHGKKLTFKAMTVKPAYLLDMFDSNPFDNFADITVNPAY